MACLIEEYFPSMFQSDFRGASTAQLNIEEC